MQDTGKISSKKVEWKVDGGEKRKYYGTDRITRSVCRTQGSLVMELKRCPDCKLLYSVSYRRCPFCEEEMQLKQSNKKRGGRRRVSEKKPVHSARGAMILILIFVLLLLSWYLFGDLLIKPDVPDEPTPPVEDPVEPVDPEPVAPVVDPEEPDEPDEPTEPDAPTPSLSKDSLTLRTIYGSVSKAAEEGADYDLTWSLSGNGSTIQFSVSGTDESVAWGSEDENILTVSDGTGLFKVKARGSAVITATVGGVTLRCIVRVTG